MDCSPPGPPGQEYWSGLPFPSPADLSIQGIEPASPASQSSQADSLPLSHLGSPIEITHSINSVYMAIPVSQFIPHPHPQQNS